MLIEADVSVGVKGKVFGWAVGNWWMINVHLRCFIVYGSLSVPDQIQRCLAFT